jgi:hypothetical protein
MRTVGDAVMCRLRGGQQQAAGIGFAKEGNCLTRIDDPDRLAQIADTLSHSGMTGRLSQVIDSWIYTACLCFGLDLGDQRRSGFGYAYSVYQVEYSRNLIFASGAVMERAFDAVVDRTRARLDVPKLRTLFGVGQRPRRAAGADLSPRQAAVIERPRWNLTLFKVHFGLLTLKGYTKGEHVLRFEAIVHNTKTLHTGRALDKFPAIVDRLASMVDRFTTMLDCVDVGFLPDGSLDQLPTPSQIGATRVGGVDVNKPRTRTTMSAVLALAVAPDGFTVADLVPRSDPSPARPRPTTPSDRPPTTCANCAANTSWTNPAGPAATTSPNRLPGCCQDNLRLRLRPPSLAWWFLSWYWE